MNTKTICTLTGQQYRAAYICRANKDVRYYLNGIFVSGEHNQVVSTDGSIMYYADIEPGESIESVIFDGPNLPVSVNSVVVSLYDEKNVLLIAEFKNGSSAQHICPRIDARYPDYKAVLNGKQGKTEFHTVSWDAKYLGMLQKIFGKVPVQFKIIGKNIFSSVTVSDRSKGTVIIMPCRLKAAERKPS